MKNHKSFKKNVNSYGPMCNVAHMQMVQLRKRWSDVECKRCLHMKKK